MAFVERRARRFGGLRLAQNAPGQLCQRRERAPGSERAQHIGKRAIPAFRQRLLGNDGAHLAGRREQVKVLRLRQIILLRGLDRDLRFSKSEL